MSKNPRIKPEHQSKTEVQTWARQSSSTALMNSNTRLYLPVNPNSLFSFSTLLASSSTLWSFSFAPFSTLFFPLHPPHVFLQTTVHHLEGSFDARGPPHLPSGTLFGHNVCYFSLLLPDTCFLVDTANKTKLYEWRFCKYEQQSRAAGRFYGVLILDRTSSAEPSSPSRRCPQCWRLPRLSSLPAPFSLTSGKPLTNSNL